MLEISSEYLKRKGPLSAVCHALRSLEKHKLWLALSIAETANLFTLAIVKRVVMALRAARITEELEAEDYMVAYAMAKNLKNRESFSLQDIESSTGLPEKKLVFILNKLNAKKLIVTQPSGYVLVSLGLDTLALHLLSRRHSVVGLGKAMAFGKEADVYEGITKNGSRVVLKFYRMGRVSFRDIRRKRDYSSPFVQHQWLTLNIRTAAREYRTLKLLSNEKVNVPRPISRIFHVVVQELIEGTQLVYLPKISRPRELLLNILLEISKAYHRARLVNGDLSEFNILFDGEKPWLIDWPQAVSLSHPNSQHLLERDVRFILKFFKRRYGTDFDSEQALRIIKDRKL